MYLLNTIQILVQSLVIVALEISVSVKIPTNNQQLLKDVIFLAAEIKQIVSYIYQLPSKKLNLFFINF
jgi:hypothetical protein